MDLEANIFLYKFNCELIFIVLSFELDTNWFPFLRYFTQLTGPS